MNNSNLSFLLILRNHFSNFYENLATEEIVYEINSEFSEEIEFFEID